MDNAAPRPPPTFAQALLAGAAAGTSVDLLFFPIDTLKTRLQSVQGFWAAGGFSGIYRGVGSVVVGSAPGAAAFFTTYEQLKHSLSSPHSPLAGDSLAPARHVLAASGAEVAACLVRVPTEVVKSAAQTGAYGGAVGSLASARRLLASEGVRGFYKGFGITVAREIPFTSIQFPLYEYFKLQIARLTGRRAYSGEAALCGSVAGGIAAVLTTPLDVAKTRVMLELRTAGDTGRRPGMLARLVQIQRAEGTRALFAGVVPRTLWISAGGAVFLGVYEWVLEMQMALS